MCARSLDKGSAAIKSITDSYPKANITLLEIDHMSLSSVVSAAKHFLSTERALHGLVNNAGIMTTPYEITKDGHEAQWQTNYLAHWVFTYHLMPILLKTSQVSAPGTVRIVNVSSSGHFWAPKEGIRFEDTDLKGETSMMRYGQSKLANILHAKSLHQRYGPGSRDAASGESGIWVSIVHPGLVDSNLTKGKEVEMPLSLKVLGTVARTLGIGATPDVGSWANLYCVASTEMTKDECGTYFEKPAKRGWESKLANYEGLATRLYEWTEAQMVQEGWIAS